MAAFIATFADGYRRTIAHPKIKTIKGANRYAKQLELWFAQGNYPGRILVSIEPKIIKAKSA